MFLSSLCSGSLPIFDVFAENWVILGVVYYPALYYPLLACGTLHNKVGYVLGSLLSWTHFGILVWQKIDCPKTPLVSKYDIFNTSLSFSASLRQQQIYEENCHCNNPHFLCSVSSV